MNQGFFQSGEVDRPAIHRMDCGVSCRLLRDCRFPKMKPTGEGKLKILVVAEAPGEKEDKENLQLFGPAGQLFREKLTEFGIDLDRDCRKTNAVRCRPPDNRAPTTQEILTCQPHIWEEIRMFKPKLIILLGQSALNSFLLNRQEKVGPIGRWRGFSIPDQKAQAWVCPTFHPSYILRSREGRVIRGKAEPIESVEEMVFTADLENALSHLRKPFPVAPVPKIRVNEVPSANFTGRQIAIDYETSGLRPWERKDHRIVSCAFGWESGACAWGMSADTIPYTKSVLIASNIQKIAHNCKFEHQWASQTLGVETQGWVWDTMLAAHMVDNRRRICKLKHQAYLNFGVEDWSGGMDFGDDEDDELNTLGSRELTDEDLRYNALDAWHTWQLYQKQKALFK